MVYIFGGYFQIILCLQVKKQAHAMEDLNNLSQSSETASKDFELADPNYEKILLLIEQHKTSCKGTNFA